ncbi:MAG: hypothetical protein JWM57_1530 [Phycisphaerales bacterium]|nr:hypothetical protein [Phycisphaerales bacterium]
MQIAFGNARLLLWILLILTSWIGWGEAARRVCRVRRIDLGLRAAWGMAITALIGGPLNAAEFCSPWVLIAITLCGAGFAVPLLIDGIQRARRHPATSIERALPLLPIVVVGLFFLISSMSALDGGINLIDDASFYFTLPIRMLETGAAIDPLNGRRLSTFGGYAFLQAQVGVVGTEWAAFVVDRGLSSVVTVMLLVGIGNRRHAWRWAACVSAAICWLFPVYRTSANCMAAMAITAMVLGTLRTVLLADQRPTRRLPLLIMAAVMATAACTFRDNILALPPLFFAIYFAHRAWRSVQPMRDLAMEAGLVIATGLLALLPWSIALFRACGSFLYPLMKGNQRDPSFTFAPASMASVDRLVVAARLLASPTFLLVYLPIVFLIFRKQWTALWMFIAAVLMSGLTAYEFPIADLGWLERFCVPALLGIGLYGVDLAIRPVAASHRKNAATAVVAATIVALLLWPWDWSAAYFRNKGKAFVDSVTTPFRFASPEAVKAYAAMQKSIPQGAVVASALDYPTLLNFARNPIYCIDIPGAATKTGIWPYRQGVYALRDFLREQGVQYVAFQEFGQAEGLHSPPQWINLMPKHDRTAERMLDMMATVEALAKVSPVVHHQDGLVAFKVQ